MSHLGPLFFFVERLLEVLCCNNYSFHISLMLIALLFIFTIYIFLILVVVSSGRPSVIILATSVVIPSSTGITSVILLFLSFILCSVVSLKGVNTVIPKIFKLPTLLLAYLGHDLKFIFWCFFHNYFILFNYIYYGNWLSTSLISKELRFGLVTFLLSFLLEGKL